MCGGFSVWCASYFTEVVRCLFLGTITVLVTHVISGYAKERTTQKKNASLQINIYDRHNKSGCKDEGFSIQTQSLYTAEQATHDGSLAELKELMIEVRLIQCPSVF